MTSFDYRMFWISFWLNIIFPRIMNEEVEFEVRAQRRRRVTLDPEVYAKLEGQARSRGLLPETLVNLWLAERLQENVS